MSGVFTAGIFLPGLIILANLLSGVFTAAGITRTPLFLNFSTQYMGFVYVACRPHRYLPLVDKYDKLAGPAHTLYVHTYTIDVV